MRLQLAWSRITSPSKHSEMKYYTVKQAAAEYGISQSLLYREMREGRLQSYRFGKRAYRIASDDLADYAKSRRCKPPSEVVTPETKPEVQPSQFKHIDVTQPLSRRK